MKEYSDLTDEQLINNIQQEVEQQKNLKELVNRHSGIYLNMIHGYMNPRDGFMRDEMIKEKEYQIYISALKYDPTKGSKFSTYLGNETKWKCLNIYNKNKRHPSIQIQEELMDYFSYKYVDDDNASSFKGEIFSHIISQANSHPDRRVGKIFTLRYVEGKNNTVMPWKNISTQLGMSIQGCINIHNSAIKQFKQKLNKE